MPSVNGGGPPRLCCEEQDGKLFGDCTNFCVRHHGHRVIDLSSFRLADHFHLHISDDLALA